MDNNAPPLAPTPPAGDLTPSNDAQPPPKVFVSSPELEAPPAPTGLVMPVQPAAAPPPPPSSFAPPALQAEPGPTELVSQPVVKVLSPRGIEYVFLTVALFTAAIALGGILISLVNGQTGFNVLSVPVAALVVALPVFAFLFLRLKKSELGSPSLKYEASKRRSTQFTQIVSFLVCFFTLIGFLATIFAKMAGQYSGSIFKVLLDVIVVIVIAGGILAYYWRDEHRLGR